MSLIDPADPKACPTEAELQGVLNQPTNAPLDGAITRHLDRCARCQERLAQLAGGGEVPFQTKLNRPTTESSRLRALVNRLRETLTTMDPPEPGAHEFRDGVLLPSTTPGGLGTFAGYEVLERIAAGGMGIVFKAFDAPLNRIVAVKVLSPMLAASDSARARFLREARAAAAVAHEFVVAIHAVGEERGLPYLVMQFVAGKSLEARLAHGPLEPKEVLRIGLQTARGLAAAHAQGLIYRDIKPGNILRENGVERVKLTDFGLARAVDKPGVTRVGVVAGTPEFMSPEQAQGRRLDARSDLFSLGVVLYMI